MNIQESWTIEGADGQPIRGDTHAPAQRAARGVLVIAHGFKGYKDYGFFPQLAQRAAEAGFIAHRFNFSHSGMTDKIETFERPDLFERDTWSRQIEDLDRVIGHRAGAAGLPVVVFGHSRGAVTALLHAARPTAHRAAGLILAASPDTACSLEEGQRAELRRTGRLASPSSRTGQLLHVGRAWLEEIEADPRAFDPVAAIGRVACPVLVIHGDGDDTVPVAAAHHLAKAGDAELHIIPGAGHTFNAPNPLAIDAEPPPAVQQLYDAALRFAERVISA